MVSVRLRGPAPTPATESRAVSSGNNPRSLHESREVAWRPGRAQCWGCRFWGPQSGASRRHPSPDPPATAPANLVTFWVGCLIASFSFPLIPLMVLHIMPMFRSLSEGMATPATSATVRHIQIGSSAIDLRADDGSPSGASAGELGRAPDGLQRLDGSAIRRVLGRAQNAWQTDRFGSHW